MTNKATVFLLCLLATTSISAKHRIVKNKTVAVPVPGPITIIPKESEGWTFEGDALYMQPSGTIQNGFSIVTDTEVLTWNMKADWGFKIAAAYLFGHGNDFNVNWSYLNQSEDLIDTGGTLYNNGFPGLVFNAIAKMSVVNLELGQHIEFGEMWHVRMHLGMQIDQTQTRATTTVASVREDDSISFNMVGARTGLDIERPLNYGFSLYTNAAIGALYSNMSVKGNTATGIISEPSNLSINEAMLSLDYHLGLNYRESMKQGDLITHVGWTSYYWFANQIGNFATPSWQGLIFGAKWVDNAK